MTREDYMGLTSKIPVAIDLAVENSAPFNGADVCSMLNSAAVLKVAACLHNNLVQLAEMSNGIVVRQF